MAATRVRGMRGRVRGRVRGFFRDPEGCRGILQITFGGEEMARPAKKKVKDALTDYMRQRGMELAHIQDMVEDYMSLYDTKTQLLRDIKQRGAKVTVYMANGTGNLKTNDSLQDFLKVNSQMLKILDTLGMDPSKAKALNGDEAL